MKLCQDQVWKTDTEFLRITRLARLEVEYKSHQSITDLDAKVGTFHTVSKKEFCRLLKQTQATLHVF